MKRLGMAATPRVLAALAFIALAVLVGPASARQESFGVDVTGLGVIPLKHYEPSVGPALGGLVGFELEAFPSFSITGRGGYIAHTRRDDFSRSLVPILGGLKITSYDSPLYVAGEVGRVKVRDRYDGSDSSVGDRRATRTAWGVGVGSAVDRLDLRVSMHFWDAANLRKSAALDVSLAFLLLGGD